MVVTPSKNAFVLIATWEDTSPGGAATSSRALNGEEATTRRWTSERGTTPFVVQRPATTLGPPEHWPVWPVLPHKDQNQLFAHHVDEEYEAWRSNRASR